MNKITLLLTVFMMSFYMYPNNRAIEEEPIKKLLINYISKINALNKGGNKQDVLKLFDEKYRGNTVYVNLSGALVRKDYEKRDISSQLDDIVNDDNYSFMMKLDDVVFQSQKERAGTISAVVSFESFINKKLAEKGTMLMDLVGIRVNGGWKIVQNNMIRVSEAKDIGECVCYMYGNGSTKFITEVYYPDGLEYSQQLGSFQVTKKEGKRIIKSQGEEFSWSGNGKLTYKGKVIGAAEKPKEAIQVAIKSLYKDACADVTFN